MTKIKIKITEDQIQIIESAPRKLDLLFGAGAAGLAYLVQPFGPLSENAQLVSSAGVGVATVIVINQPLASAVTAGYLGYAFATEAAAEFGHVVGTIAAAACGGGLAYGVVDKNRAAALVAGAAVGGIGGYFTGGIATEILAVAACALAGAVFRSRENIIGLCCATAIGYFGATAFIERNVMPTRPQPAPVSVYAPVLNK